ncbi:Calcium-binding protein E63-1 [Eumeta japonica]|uniref:Calcium-binding protein E63-1 n=1 Tax=Eumeta variegata TaxID=151549 RepID=A0A4C1UBC0_EUMVA|nr:Calcium-binding protein E63-1 [Eumeta japonica]
MTGSSNINITDNFVKADSRSLGNGLIDENEFMQWVTKIQALQGLDVSTSGGDSEEEITKDLLAAFK